ncbi:hypothetical protein ACFWZ1_10475 [Frateuria sp. GZRe14]|jgi:Tol biopolymer transport system component|uniref:hypothetical protein n=1 Tax=Frateuria sp. GZRe14 TaxID=3351534 RepID=UPI003EDC6769
MKNHKLAGSICALLLTALGVSTAAAQTATASILVTRPIYRFDGAHGSQLYRVDPSGQNLTTLVPVTYGVDFENPSWSPGGSSVVFEAVARETNGTYSGSQLYVVNRQGGSPRQLTTGDGQHSHPLWGPNGVIAFVTTKGHGQCLATVRGDGTDQHIVFCPPGEQGESWSIWVTLSRWTASGNGILLVASAPEGGLEPEKSYSDAWRVNVSTGAAVKLTAQVFDDNEGDLVIAPDGKHGVFGGGQMYAIDFTTNTLTPLSTYGTSLVYSPDGSKIAFLHYEPSIETSRIYIMRADGSNIHLAPAQTTNPDVYNPSISDWSADGSRLLFNQVGNNQWVRMIDLRNKTARNVTNGVAAERAWFHP